MLEHFAPYLPHLIVTLLVLSIVIYLIERHTITIVFGVILFLFLCFYLPPPKQHLLVESYTPKKQIAMEKVEMLKSKGFTNASSRYIENSDKEGMYAVIICPPFSSYEMAIQAAMMYNIQLDENDFSQVKIIEI